MDITKEKWQDYWGETNNCKQIFQIHCENDSTMIIEGSETSTDLSLKELEKVVKLISAAPELLEACEYAFKMLSKVDITIETTKIHKAINKAEGGS